MGMKMVAIRLHRGDDLKKAIEGFIETQDISAGAVICAVGCLSQAKLRMAGATPDRQDVRTYREPLEIVSLIGVAARNRKHLHLAVSNREGQVFGGHLKEGCIVDTTVELIIAADDKLEFGEEPDPVTGFGELMIRSTKGGT
jgi:predicted DNA-binding protein with PD1-like motif